MFKLMTLNLFRYNDWPARQAAIIDLINHEQPDVIAFQEVLNNPAFSNFAQSEDIARACSYGYHSFAPTLLRMNARDRQGNRTQQASEGQAIISKHPITSSDNYFLRQHEAYPEDVSAQICQIDIDGCSVNICNIHLANNDVAYQQLDELLAVIEQRGRPTIIAGDFNIYKLAEYKKDSKLLQQYTLSSDVADYISYPPDQDTLDYIAVPSDVYHIQNVQCPKVYASDHRPLIATIEYL